MTTSTECYGRSEAQMEASARNWNIRRMRGILANIQTLRQREWGKDRQREAYIYVSLTTAMEYIEDALTAITGKGESHIPMEDE